MSRKPMENICISIGLNNHQLLKIELSKYPFNHLLRSVVQEQHLAQISILN